MYRLRSRPVTFPFVKHTLRGERGKGDSRGPARLRSRERLEEADPRRRVASSSGQKHGPANPRLTLVYLRQNDPQSI